MNKKLKFKLHERKIIICKYGQGVDFLGYVVLPYYRVLHTKTKRRMMRKLRCKVIGYRQGNVPKLNFDQSLQSYLGVLKHCNGFKIKQIITKLPI